MRRSICAKKPHTLPYNRIVAGVLHLRVDDRAADQMSPCAQRQSLQLKGIDQQGYIQYDIEP